VPTSTPYPLRVRAGGACDKEREGYERPSNTFLVHGTLCPGDLRRRQATRPLCWSKVEGSRFTAWSTFLAVTARILTDRLLGGLGSSRHRRATHVGCGARLATYGTVRGYGVYATVGRCPMYRPGTPNWTGLRADRCYAPIGGHPSAIIARRARGVIHIRFRADAHRTLNDTDEFRRQPAALRHADTSQRGHRIR